MNLDVSPVFLKNWEAINEKTAEGKRIYRYIINEGSSRSSKTFSFIDIFDLIGRTVARKRLTVWRDTKTDCVNTVLNDAVRHFSSDRVIVNDEEKRIVPRWLKGFRFNITKSIFTYTTGTTFEIQGTDDENTVMGLNQHVAWLNEPYKISRTIFDQIDQRTEDFIIIDWNPKIAHWIEDLKKDKRAIVIHSTFRDNPFCPIEQKNKILSYQPVKMCSIVEQKLLIEKEAAAYDLVTNEKGFSDEMILELDRCRENEFKKSASEYNWSVYGLGIKSERPNRIFHFAECKLSEYLALQAKEYFYSDWGAVDPWAIGAIKYYDGCLYIRELNYESENEIRAKLSATERTQMAGDDEGIVSWMFNKLGVPRSAIIICDPNRLSKIRALRMAGFDYAQPASKPPGSIMDGVDLLNNLNVYYTDNSVNVKYEQENYSRKIDRYGVVLEEPEDINNHHLDGTRYIGTYLQMQGIINKI
jgi:phage terminase large subunit